MDSGLGATMADPSASAVRWVSYLAENGILDADETPSGMVWPPHQNVVDCRSVNESSVLLCFAFAVLVCLRSALLLMQ